MEMNLHIPQNAGNIMAGWYTIRLSRMTASWSWVIG